MRIVVDPELCEGNGVCEKLAPEVFRVGDDDRAHVSGAPLDAFREKIELAIVRCPRQAIRADGG